MNAASSPTESVPFCTIVPPMKQQHRLAEHADELGAGAVRRRDRRAV